MSAYITTGAHPLFTQILNGHEVWRRCTPKQRELLKGLRTEINDRKKTPDERYAIHNRIEAPARTLASLHSKGVCDADGLITMLGAYGALWGPGLEEQLALRRAQREAS